MTVAQLILGLIVLVAIIKFRQPSAEPWTAHRVLRYAMALWAIAFPVVACSPVFLGASSSSGAAAGGLVGMVIGATILVPWLIGLVVLAVLYWVTNPHTV